MRNALYQTVQRQVGHEFPEIFAFGSEPGCAVFLGRPAGGGPLAILRLQAEEGSREHRLQVMRWLDTGLPVGFTTCTACGKRQVGWPRYCGKCETDLAGTPADGLADLLVPGGYQLLGALRRAEGGAPLHFAREVATGRVVGLAERPGADGAVELTPAWVPVSPPSPPGWLTMAAAGVALVAAALLVAAVVAARGPRMQTTAAAAGSSIVDTTGMQVRNSPVATPPSTVPVEGAAAAEAGKDSSPSTRDPSSRPVETEESRSRAEGGRRMERNGSAPAGPATVPPPRPAPSTPAPAPTPQGVEAAIARYASAVASGQTRRITRVYPGITSAEVERWNRFFAPLGPDAGLRASHEVVSGPTVEGNRAEVIFTLTLYFRNSAGAPEDRSLPLRALLRWTGTAWSLQEVRLLQ